MRSLRPAFALTIGAIAIITLAGCSGSTATETADSASPAAEPSRLAASEPSLCFQNTSTDTYRVLPYSEYFFEEDVPASTGEGYLGVCMQFDGSLSGEIMLPRENWDWTAVDLRDSSEAELQVTVRELDRCKQDIVISLPNGSDSVAVKNCGRVATLRYLGPDTFGFEVGPRV
jgi:hypothetical protein